MLLFTLLETLVVCLWRFVVFMFVVFGYFSFGFDCLRILIALMLDLYSFGFGFG